MKLDTDEPEITLDELRHLFGTNMPMDAVAILMDGDITLPQCRMALVRMAALRIQAENRTK